MADSGLDMDMDMDMGMGTGEICISVIFCIRMTGLVAGSAETHVDFYR